MNPFRRRPDPIALREKELRAKIQSLEAQIQDLHKRIAQAQAQPKLRSTVAVHKTTEPPVPDLHREPRFEDVSHDKVQKLDATFDDPAHYNELGLRKYDPFSGIRRWLDKLKGQPRPTSPKFVSYLAAGSIHGLRPLRYEKRLARNWFFALCAFFLLMLWGLIYFYSRVR